MDKKEETFYTQSINELYEKLDTNINGIDDKKAEDRLKQNGKNELLSAKKHGKFYMFMSQFKDIMLIILLVAAVLNAVVAILNKTYSDLIDVGLILVIVLLNAFMGYIQEVKAEDALASLKKMSQPFVKVKRNGVIEKILTTDVVVGDILILEAGDVCCADVRLIESASLMCDESSLTGESIQIQKDCNKKLKNNTPLGDRINMVYSGSIINYGRGVGLVVATGMQTEIGKIASMLNVSEDESTPIQQKLAKLGKIISFVVLGIALLIFIINVVISKHSILDSLLVAIALAVAAIPESLPAVISIVMSLGVSRMSKQRAIIRKMHAVETLGSCQIICSDKTGTLTQNKMVVQSLYFNDKIYQVDEKINPEEKLLQCMSLCNDSAKNGDKYTGDPTEIALVEYADKYKYEKSIVDKKYVRVDELPFDSNRKMMTTYNKVGSKVIGFTKGAPDVLLSKCSHILINNKVQKLTKAMEQNVLASVESMSLKGLRTLGHAYKDARDTKHSLKDEDKLIFVGVVGMRDPPREQAKEAVETCIRAGMKPIMITGDHAITAREIAREVGIYKEGDMVLTGAELDALKDEEYKKIIGQVSVYARVSPENKVRIVEIWKSMDKVVAMTGDGVNDAPSIKKADIGVGMGITGTEVTKEVADMVLTDDNFATIIGAVKEGRITYQNIKKVIHFLFGTNLVEVATILLITLINPTLAFLTAIQILFVNMVTDTLPAISLSVEKGEKDIMNRPPRDKKEGLFVGVLSNMFIQFIWQTIVIVGLFMIVYNATSSNILATTMAFSTLSLCQIFHMINVRTEYSIFSQNPFTNKLFWLTLICGVLINIAVVAITPIANVFGLIPLTLQQWLMVFVCALSVIPVMEVVKLIKKLKKHK